MTWKREGLGMEPMEEPGDKERAGDGGPDEELEEVFMLTAERCSDGDW